MRQTFLFSFFALLIVLSPSAQAKDVKKNTDRVEIHLHPEALVRGQEFTIGEVADLVPAEGVLAEQVRKIVISRSPWPGYAQRVNYGMIRMALRSRVEDLSKIKIRGVEECKVKIRSIKISGDTFLAAAREHLLQKLPFPTEQVEITSKNKIQDRYVPIGIGDGPVLEIRNGDQQNKRGLVRLQVRVLVDGLSVYQTSIGFNVRVFKEIVVAARNIARNAVLSPKNTTLKRREITDFTVGYFTEKEEIYGKRAIKNIRADTMLTSELIKTPPVIARKSMVDILYHSNSIRISLKGIAEEAGATGDIIRVRSLTSRRQLFCQIVDSRTVQIASR